jgi:uncharacterized Rmd1/YagE family protein
LEKIEKLNLEKIEKLFCLGYGVVVVWLACK